MGRFGRLAAAGLVLTVLLASCGGDDEEQQTTTSRTSQSSGGAAAEEPSDAPGGETEASSAELDLGSDTIQIGFSAPFSGPIGYFGELFGNSLQVEIDRINAEGGLGGAQLELVTRDTELNPQLAVQAAQEFAGDDRVAFVVGPLFSSFFNASKQIYEDSQTVNCQPGVNAPGLFDDLEYAFRGQDAQDHNVPPLLEHLSQQGVESIGLIYENDDTGQSYDQLLSELVAKYGMTYVGFQATRPDDQTHRPQVEALQDTGALLISNNSSNAAKSAVAAEEVGYEGTLVGFTGLFGFTYPEGAADAAVGTTMGAWYAGAYSRLPEAEWPEAYRRHINAVIEQYGTQSGPQSGIEVYNGAVIAANCIVLFEKAVEQAGSLEPDEVVAAWGVPRRPGRGDALLRERRIRPGRPRDVQRGPDLDLGVAPRRRGLVRRAARDRPRLRGVIIPPGRSASAPG